MEWLPTGRSPEDFFDRFSRGQTDDSADFVEWANDYRHYLALRLDMERQLSHVV